MTTTHTYDFIIAGGGLAGLSLAYQLNQSTLSNRKLLIIDANDYEKNDKTWCFWEKEPTDFESIVAHSWQGVWFHGNAHFSSFLPLDEYRYKMIRSIDFYQYVKKTLANNPAITWLQATVTSIQQTTVHTNQGIFEANTWVFDSINRPDYQDKRYLHLLQHFKGWEIESDKPFCQPDKPTLFDFNIPQHQECRFVYILPDAPNKALVEFTIFSDNLLSDIAYEAQLRHYIEDTLGLQSYTVTAVENGIIPMSSQPHIAMPQAGVIRIGTAGGYVKASTGYSFQRTQRQSKALVYWLENPSSPQPWRKNRFRQAWKHLLDSVLLQVMHKKMHPSDDIFTRLFRDNRPAQILKFLDEDTTLLEDLRIMQTVPIIPFIKAVFCVFLRKILSYFR